MTVDEPICAYSGRSVRQALMSVPEHLRVPLVMRRGLEASDRDIAEALAISSTQAARRVQEGAALLYACLARDGVPVSAVDAMLGAHLATRNADFFVDRVMRAVGSADSPKPFVTAVECAAYATAGAVLDSSVIALRAVL